MAITRRRYIIRLACFVPLRVQPLGCFGFGSCFTSFSTDVSSASTCFRRP